MVTLPPRSRIVAMGRVSKESGKERLRSVMVKPVPMKNPGVYVARVVSDVFERIHQFSQAIGCAPKPGRSSGST